MKGGAEGLTEEEFLIEKFRALSAEKRREAIRYLDFLGEADRNSLPVSEKKAVGRAKKRNERRAYQMEISMLGSRPSYWRKIQVPAGLKLMTFAWILPLLFQLPPGGVFRFVSGGQQYGEPQREWELEEVIRDGRKTTLEKLIASEGEKFQFIYKESDRWDFAVQFYLNAYEVNGPVAWCCMDGGDELADWEALTQELRQQAKLRDL